MRLYLLRHGEAAPTASVDAARRLTGKGEAQAARVGKFCLQHGLVPELILASPVLRARQTAECVAGEIGAASELLEAPWASCGMSPRRAIDELGAYTNFGSLMLVGHEPDLGLLASALIGLTRPMALHVRKALLMAIDFHGVPAEGCGELQLFVPAKLM